MTTQPQPPIHTHGNMLVLDKTPDASGIDIASVGILLDKYAVDTSKTIDRVTSVFLNTILGWIIPIHTHGFIRVIDYMGDDSSIVQAARVSYGKGTTTKSEDAGLLSYLVENYHTSPVEQVRIKFHIKAPIFVARQWLRTRMASTNEYSGRYSIMDGECYIPEFEFIAAQSKDNKQGRGAELTLEQKKKVQELLIAISDESNTTYHKLLDDDIGLARELARIGLTLNTYTEWYWTVDAHNLFNFLRLRMHHHAQREIRDYADAIWMIVEGWLPLTARAVKNFVLDGERFSGAAMAYLRARIDADGGEVEKVSGMSRREKTKIDQMFKSKPRGFLSRLGDRVLNNLCFYKSQG